MVFILREAAGADPKASLFLLRLCTEASQQTQRVCCRVKESLQRAALGADGTAVLNAALVCCSLCALFSYSTLPAWDAQHSLGQSHRWVAGPSHSAGSNGGKKEVS